MDRTDPETTVEMKIVRRLRQAFIVRHCGCTWVPLPDHAEIAGLEAQVIALAPPEMVAWNRRGMAVYDEPVALVDALIAELRLSPIERAALTFVSLHLSDLQPSVPSPPDPAAGGL